MLTFEGKTQVGTSMVTGISIWSGGQFSPSFVAELGVPVVQDLLLPPVSAKKDDAHPSTCSPNARPKIVEALWK